MDFFQCLHRLHEFKRGGFGNLVSGREKIYHNFCLITYVFDAWLCNITEQELIEKIISVSPSIVGISCYRSNLEQVENIIQLLRNNIETTIICGGYGATFHDEYFLNIGVDIVVQ